MIQVEKIDERTYRVVVKDAATTTHTVHITPDYYDKLTGGRVSPETLIESSFEFLLQREPNTSILSTFDLPVIGRYFPEYEGTMKKILR
ncbi:MAG: hypothetical protein BMS9Abin10_0979 [Gammaproteobacteria bacterium]|nr:MAG: hypothetical protein BMS9Abin10_0979 [Gammaproteobacteria bacterium]